MIDSAIDAHLRCALANTMMLLRAPGWVLGAAYR